MYNFQEIRNHCLQDEAISREVLNDFLPYYAAGMDKLDKVFDRKVKNHKKAVAALPQSTINLMKSQFIIHKVFKSEGLIHKYLNHSHIKDLPKEQYLLLERHSKFP